MTTLPSDHRPPAARPRIDDCRSCGAPRTGRYCSACGERALEPDEFTLRRFLRESLRELVGGEGSRLWRSFRALALEPGRLTNEYLAGRRRPWLRPLQLFLLANLLYFVVQPFTIYTGYNTTLQSQLERQVYSDEVDLAGAVEAGRAAHGWSMETYAELYNLQSSAYARTLVILMVPLLAGVLAVLLWRRRRPIVHHLVFALHFYAFELVFLSSLFLLVWGYVLRAGRALAMARGVDPGALEPGSPAALLVFFVTEMPTAPLLLVFLYLAARRVYVLSRPAAGLLALVLVPALMYITLAYRFILFWITVATL